MLNIYIYIYIYVKIPLLLCWSKERKSKYFEMRRSTKRFVSFNKRIRRMYILLLFFLVVVIQFTIRRCSSLIG